MSEDAAEFINESLSQPVSWKTNFWNLALFICKRKDKDINEDSACFINCGKDKIIIAVADGMGGHPQADVASKIAIEEVTKRLVRAGIKDSYRSEILDAYESANRKILDLKTGAGTTLIVCELHRLEMRVYHAGDSALALFGGRGRLKFKTVGHSPFELGQEAGLVGKRHDDEDVLRSTVTNYLGSDQMRVEMGPVIAISPLDFIIMGSDGLFDNQSVTEIQEFLRGTVEDVCLSLSEKTLERMDLEDPGVYSKPDDLTMFVIRPAN